MFPLLFDQRGLGIFLRVNSLLSLMVATFIASYGSALVDTMQWEWQNTVAPKSKEHFYHHQLK